MIKSLAKIQDNHEYFLLWASVFYVGFLIDIENHWVVCGLVG